MDIKIEGLQEVIKALDKTGKDSEKKIRSYLNKQGREFINAAKENTPKGKTGKLKKSYVNMQVKRNFSDYDKPIRNKAPHHHLVNNGHRLVRNGRVIGFVPGKHYIEQTVAETEDDFYSASEEFLNELFGDLI